MATFETELEERVSSGDRSPQKPLRRSPEQQRDRIALSRLQRQGQNDTRRGNSPKPQGPSRGIKPLPPQAKAVTAAQQAVARKRTARENQSRQTINQGQGESQEQSKNPMVYLIYLIAFSVAIFKDLIDFIGIGSLPVIGWLITAMASALIFVLLFFTDTSVNMKQARRLIIRIVTLVGVGVVEGVFVGVNLFPLETAAVALIFFLDVFGDTAAKVALQSTPAGRAIRTVVK